MLGKPIRVVLTDGRVIDGNLQCMDKDLNFIIGEANEFHGVEDRKSALFVTSGLCSSSNTLLLFILLTASNINTEVTVTRNIGNAMIPGAHVVKILAVV